MQGFMFILFSFFTYFVYSAPVISKVTTMRNLNTTFPNVFSQYDFDYIAISISNKFTQIIAPKISSNCMYASVENFLTESNYIMPQECGLVATMTVHDSAFTKSIVEVGTYACTQYHRDKCNPPLQQYYLNVTDQVFLNDLITYYEQKKPTVSFRHVLDTTLLKTIIVLKDEYTGLMYWITEYCMKYMTVTTDNKFVHLGPGVHHYDAATKQFCLADYSNMCTPAGPYKTKLELLMSLPMEITISSERSYNKYFEKKTYDDTIKKVIPYDDNNRIELDRNGLFVYVGASIRPMQPTYQCVKYHYVPMTTIFHIDVIVESLEKKFLYYFSHLGDYILDNLHKFFDYLLQLFEKIFLYLFKKLFTLSIYLIATPGVPEAFILTIFLLISDNNYTTIVLIITCFITIKYWLIMW